MYLHKYLLRLKDGQYIGAIYATVYNCDPAMNQHTFTDNMGAITILRMEHVDVEIIK